MAEPIANDGVVLVFPGQGSQWVGMARDLLTTSPVFAERFAECDRAFAHWLSWSVVDVVREAQPLDQIDVIQPVLFGVMVSLAALWQTVGIRVVGVVGSSQGEVAAAYVAGALSLADAVKVIAVRSRLFADELVGSGAIASVAAGANRVRDVLRPWVGRLTIAGENSPAACSVAGEPQALAEFVQACVDQGLRARVVPATVASHCDQVDPLRGRLAELLEPVAPRGNGAIAFYSTVTGGPLDHRELTGEYWFDNARRPVAFEAATRAALADGHRVFVEASPHPVLSMAVLETAESAGVEVFAGGTLRRDENDTIQLLTAIGDVFTAGVDVDWATVVGSGPRAALPTYAFRRTRYWLDTARMERQERVAAPASSLARAIESGDLTAVEQLLDITGDQPFNQVLPVLIDWDRQQTTHRVVDSWRHRIVWRRLGCTAPTILSGTWAVAAPKGSHRWLRAWAEALADRGVAVEWLDLDPADPEALSRALNTVPLLSGVLLADSVQVADMLIDGPVWQVTRADVASGARVIHLPEPANSPAARHLGQALAGDHGENHLLVRDDGLYVRRLVPAHAPQPERQWRARGTVLVTDGDAVPMGEVVRWLAAAGAEHVLLTGVPSETVAKLSAEVDVPVTTAGPATDRHAVPGPLTGVVHLGGARTARLLHELTDDIDFLLLCSSFDELGDEAVAAVVRQRREQGLPVTSVVWGPWTGEPEPGLRLLPVDLVGTALQRIMAEADADVVLVEADWSQVTATGRLFDDLTGDRRDRDETADRPPELVGLSESERLAAMTSFVCARAAAVLGHHTAADVQPDTLFLELGFDSLTGAELRVDLSRATGTRLPANLVFAQPTPAAVAGLLLRGEGSLLASSTLTEMLATAMAEGTVSRFLRTVDELARFQQTDGPGDTRPVTLAEDTGEPLLFCYPTFVGRSGAHHFARLAGALRGQRGVTVLPHPGFLRGEWLPGDLDALLDAHADTVTRHAAGRPFV